jgi:DNA-binding response OmpR family regulator
MFCPPMGTHMTKGKQMPIVDGLSSTKMIRTFEKSHPMIEYSHRATFHGRVPVFAVSASLVEKDLQVYMDAGFDGWILKPVDFHRLNELFTGIVEQDAREACLYIPGKWERGGWFARREADISPVDTASSGSAKPSTTSSEPKSLSPSSEEDPYSEELDTPSGVQT